jgi:hypothetical protein
MSSEGEPIGLEIGEKFFGILIIIIGFIIFYYAFTSYSDLSTVVAALPFLVPWVFLLSGAAFFVVGFLFLLSKEEEE